MLSGLLLLLGYKNLPLANGENGERKIINKGKIKHWLNNKIIKYVKQRSLLINQQKY